MKKNFVKKLCQQKIFVNMKKLCDMLLHTKKIFFVNNNISECNVRNVDK